MGHKKTDSESGKNPAMDGSPGAAFRKKERLVVHLTGLLEGKQVQGQGILLNLSLTGCAMRSDRNLKVGESISLRIFFPENPVPYVVPKAEVRWVTAGKCGLAFINLDSDGEPRLRQLLQEHRLFLK